MITTDVVPVDRAVNREPGHWHRRALSVLIFFAALTCVGVYTEILLLLARRWDPSDAFVAIAYTTLVYLAFVLIVSASFVRLRRPVPVTLRWAALSSCRRAQRVLTRLEISPSSDRWSAWQRGTELAVRRAAGQLVAGGVALLLLGASIGLYLATVESAAFGGSDWMTGASLGSALALMVTGYSIGMRGGESTATKVWRVIEDVALLDESSVAFASLAARRRNVLLSRMATALSADLVSYGLANNQVNVRRAAGTAAAVVARLEGALGVPREPWRPAEFAPIVTAWITGRWDDLPVSEPSVAVVAKRSLPRLLGLFVGFLLCLGLGLWAAKETIGDWSALVPLLGAAFVLAKVFDDWRRGALRGEDLPAAIENIVDR